MREQRFPVAVMHRRFVVDVLWWQPVSQDYEDDWGQTIGAALHEDAACQYDIHEGPLNELGVVSAITEFSSPVSPTHPEEERG